MAATEHDTTLRRMTHRYMPGDLVRAILEIVFVAPEETVPEGTLGRVDNPWPLGTYGIAIVRWDNGIRRITSADCFDPVPG